jgi:hypothetical protein
MRRTDMNYNPFRILTGDDPRGDDGDRRRDDRGGRRREDTKTPRAPQGEVWPVNT